MHIMGQYIFKNMIMLYILFGNLFFHFMYLNISRYTSIPSFFLYKLTMCKTYESPLKNLYLLPSLKHYEK